MKIFVSYSRKDREKVDIIVTRLREDGHDVWIDSLKLKAGDNFSQKIHDGLKDADVLVTVISQNSLSSEWVMYEFTAIALQQLSSKEQRIVPVRLEPCTVPSYLGDRAYVDLANDFQSGLDTLSVTLKQVEHSTISEAIRPVASKRQENRDSQITALTKARESGQLTLFCGAGVSLAAGIPAWDELLTLLLQSAIGRITTDQTMNFDDAAAREFKKRYGGSSIILGKYLKNNLGRDFAIEVQKVLYTSNPTGCPLIDAIVRLSTNQRNDLPLDSIVTFNFDCLLEENLKSRNVRCKEIFSESIQHDRKELPIYHVHGYLPRSGDIPNNMELVFSEDSYHTQFMTPYSWSNLIQLNKLTQNICLFIGISLSDPNMRRLLDVAYRKDANNNLRHYIVKRSQKLGNGDISDSLADLLEEQDANALGMNVLWIEEWTDLPDVLDTIAH